MEDAVEIAEESESESESSEEEEEEESSDDIDQRLDQMLENDTDKFRSVCLEFSDSCSCLSYCSTGLLCVGTISGSVKIFHCDEEELLLNDVSEIKCFDEFISTTGIDYDIGRNTAYAASRNFQIQEIDLTTQVASKFVHLDNRVNTDLNAIKTITKWIFATGDIKGQIKIWDSRILQPGAVGRPTKSTSDRSEDYISDLIVSKDGRKLAATGGAGYISIFDLRNLKCIHQNTQSPCDILTMDRLETRNEIVASNYRGDFIISSWEGNRDQIVGHTPLSCACNGVKSLSNDTIITAWDNDCLRIYGIYPYKSLGIIGKKSYRADHIALNDNKNVLFGTGYDNVLRCWDVSPLQEDPEFALEEANDFFADL